MDALFDDRNATAAAPADTTILPHDYDDDSVMIARMVAVAGALFVLWTLI